MRDNRAAGREPGRPARKPMAVFPSTKRTKCVPPGLRSLGLGLLLGGLVGASAPAQSVNEYQMKAAYVYNLAKFVEWPADTFKTARDPIGICVLGQSPIFAPLSEAVNGEMIDDHKLSVRQVSDVGQAGHCQILFVGSADRKYLQFVLQDQRTAGILTVGEKPAFAAEGGVVAFALVDNRVQIEINLEAAERQKLRISPKLLSLARIVKP